MALAQLCLILIVFWTLFAYMAIPAPINDPLFAWLRRQWSMEGTAILAFMAMAAVLAAQWRQPRTRRIAWWKGWWIWIAWAGVSVLYSIDRGLTLRSWTAFVSYGFLAYVVAQVIRTPRELVAWVRFLVLAALIVSLEGLMQHGRTFQVMLPLLHQLKAGGLPELQGWGGDVIEDFLTRKRIFSVFGWPNLFAGFLLLMIPITIGATASAASRAERIIGVVVTVVLGTCLILTLSLGAWMAAVFAGSLAWWLIQRATGRASSPSGGRRRFALVVCIALAVCAMTFVTSFIVAKRARPLIAASASSRLVYLQGAARVIEVRPLLGSGLGTFGMAYWALMPPQFANGQHSAIHAHNTIMEFAAELGLIGVTLFVMFLWAVGGLVARAIHRSDSPRSLMGVRRGLAIGVLTFFLYSVLEQTFFETVTAPFWWFALGLLTSSLSMGRPDSSDRATSSSRISTRWLPSVVVVVGLVLVVRCAVADLWAAQGAIRASAGNAVDSLDASTAFTHAQRWDPLTARYPMEQGERLLSRLDQPNPAAVPQYLERAARHFQRVVTLSPWFGYAWWRLGQVQWRLGRAEEAVNALRQAVRWDPNARAAPMELAHILLATQRYRELQQVAVVVQQRDPTSPHGWFLEALAWQGLAQPHEAIRCYRALVQRTPDAFAAWFNLGELWRQLGRPEEAAAAYQTFLRLAPETETGPRLVAHTFVNAAHQPRGRQK